MHLQFEPGDLVDATKIGMVQSVKTVVDGKPVLTDPSQESRYVASGPGQGYRIDRLATENNPIFGAGSLRADERLADTASFSGKENAQRQRKIHASTTWALYWVAPV